MGLTCSMGWLMYGMARGTNMYALPGILPDVSDKIENRCS